MGTEGLVPLHSPEEIREKVRALGSEITRDYAGREPIAVCVLQGAFVFFADLLRRISLPVRCDFIQAASYGSGTEGAGRVEIVRDLQADVAGRHVILIDDIVDTGRTARSLLDAVREKGPETIEICALLDKVSRRAVEVPLRYRGFVVPDRFVVGYGLDLGGLYRNEPGLWTLPDDHPALRIPRGGPERP